MKLGWRLGNIMSKHKRVVYGYHIIHNFLLQLHKISLALIEPHYLSPIFDEASQITLTLTEGSFAHCGNRQTSTTRFREKFALVGMVRHPRSLSTSLSLSRDFSALGFICGSQSYESVVED